MAATKQQYLLRGLDREWWQAIKKKANAEGYKSHLRELIVLLLDDWLMERKPKGSIVNNHTWAWVLKYSARINKTPEEFVRIAICRYIANLDPEKFQQGEEEENEGE